MQLNSFKLAFIWLCTTLVTAGSLSDEYSKASNASLLWGPYRPGLYVGVRPRIPHSLLSGLMWYSSNSLEGIQSVRHACDQGDDMNGYGWVQYDPRFGGRQIIRDAGHEVDLTIEYVKTDADNWILRVHGEPYEETGKTSIVFYSALEGTGTLDLTSKLESTGIKGDVELSGRSPDFGKFNLKMTEPESNRHPSSSHIIEKKRPGDRTHYASLTLPNDKAWLAKDIFLTFAQDSVTAVAQEFQEHEMLPTWNPYFLLNRADMKGNVHFMQRTYEGPFTFDVIFNTAKNPVESKSFDKSLKSALNKFEEKFSNAFDLQPPYNTDKYHKFAQEMISNLLGGIGYFYGDHLVDRSDAEEYLEDVEEFWEGAAEKLKLAAQEAVHEGPYELFTCVPSRPFFPRGFYWDEGFHLMPVLNYDPDLAFEIIKSWFDLVDEDGWIAREQILGDEARSRVPDEFKTQFPHIANPPTLMMLFSEIVTKVNKNSKSSGTFDSKKLGNVHLETPELLLSYVRDIYPSLQRHFEWFRKTQRGEIKTWDRQAFSSREGYRWRGRTPSHCLASGLDDYPRAPIPHTGELHVDLLSWIGMFTRSMKNLAEVLGETEDVAEYAKREEAIIRNLDDLHWSKANQTYCDVTIDDYDESAFVCHNGYVSLLPFMLKLIPADSEHLGPILKLIGDPSEVWTRYGIASLSKKDDFFGKGEDYWRGSIWMNMNHLMLDAFQYYHAEENTSAKNKKIIEKLYKELRNNCVSTVYDGWKQTGFAYEHYSALDGKPVGVKHFLGWTSLVVEFMAMPETLSEKEYKDEL